MNAVTEMFAKAVTPGAIGVTATVRLLLRVGHLNILAVLFHSPFANALDQRKVVGSLKWTVFLTILNVSNIVAATVVRSFIGGSFVDWKDAF